MDLLQCIIEIDGRERITFVECIIMDLRGIRRQFDCCEGDTLLEGPVYDLLQCTE